MSSPRLFLVAPFLTISFLGIGAVALAQGAIQNRSLDLEVALILLPAVLALLSAPGFLYAVELHDRWREQTRGTKAFVRVSLFAACAAAAGAMVVSIPTGIGPLLSLAALVSVVKLWRSLPDGETHEAARF